MPTVEELKAQAKTSEESGNPNQAFVVYEQILEQLGESPEELKDAAAICARVGDLRVQLGQPARAFASYRHAADYGARLGSSEQIVTVCERMVNVVPAAGDSYTRCARLLLGHGHARAALDVLAAFAEKASLDSARSKIATLSTASGVDRETILALLAEIERDTHGIMFSAEPIDLPPVAKAGKDIATASRRVRRASIQPARIATTDQTQTPPVSARAHRETQVGRGRARRSTWVPIGTAAVVALIAIGIFVSTKGNAAPDTTEVMASLDAATESSVAQPIDTPAPAETSTRSSNPPALVANPPAQAQQPAQQPAARPVATTTTPPQPESRATTTPPANQQPNPSQARATAASQQPDSTPASTTTTTQPATRSDTAPRIAPPPVVLQPVQVPDVGSGSSATQPVVIGDLPVVNVTQVDFRGQRGYRVVHRLDDGEQFVVESYPVDSNTATTYPLGTVIVNAVPPDTTVSIVRYNERYLVFASGVLPEDSVRVLLRSLRIRGQ